MKLHHALAHWKIILSCLGLVVLAGIAGNLDYQDQLLIEADYCDRLLNKEHSDYNNLRDVCAERHWSN